MDLNPVRIQVRLKKIIYLDISNNSHTKCTKKYSNNPTNTFVGQK